ncbi:MULTISPECIES: HEAT repeat domain-containing protein [Polyangium]|uniref:HEAT repeat domain-containing protein n=2 Tax=Polyangium TaxID=55 RepID=A0A4U1JFW9_9BACT|nr:MULTISPECIES: HEAT repeat domain-containing protein [Polyangium]MDI1430674.1 HEAT repeat domain-containing protein [Polyangium sorediatum]TKD09975.1 HEAT repeat domain-containing protein [Polyangium fumosum]
MRSVDGAGPRPKTASVLATCLVALGMGLVSSGCRVDDNDIHRWENTAHGPKKLCAVLLYDKYDTSLRVESALALIRMKPRSGRRLAFTQIDSEDPPENEACKGSLVDVLSGLRAEVQGPIVSQLVSSIIVELKRPPPVAQPGQPAPADGSFPYKDAAYAMLVADKPPLVTDEGLKQTLRGALVEWAMADFERRLESRGQAYGMEQLLRVIGVEAVVGLPKLMTKETRKLDAMASLVAELGDAKTKEAASAALVEVAKWILSDDWTKVRTPELKDSNAAQKLTPTEEQFKKQIEALQDDELIKVFASMRKVGGRPVVDHLLGFAARKDQSEKRRQTALAALEGHLKKDNADDVKRILEIAGSDAPDVVLDQAFRRIGELPREAVVEKLYALFKTDKWKVRRAAATTVLKMSTVKDVGEFLGKLPDDKNFALGEALTYGAYMGELKEGTPLDALKKYFGPGSPAARTSAIAYYFTYGTSADVSALSSLESDEGRAPKCDSDPDCKWVCDVPKEGSQEREQKEIKTIGEFVRHCVVPAMKERKPEAAKEQKK